MSFGQSCMKYNIEGQFSFNVPNDFEVQKMSEYDGSTNVETINTYEATDNEIYVESTTDAKHFVLQQKGLNQHEANAYKLYSRIIVDYYSGEEDFPQYGESIEVDYEEIQNIVEKLDSSLSANGMNILKVLDYGGVSVNGFPALRLEYLRRGYNNAGTVHCISYEIYNWNEVVVLVISNRETEQNIYNTEKEIINSFEFTETKSPKTNSIKRKENTDDSEHFLSGYISPLLGVLLVVVFIIVCILFLIMRFVYKHKHKV